MFPSPLRTNGTSIPYCNSIFFCQVPQMPCISVPQRLDLFSVELCSDRPMPMPVQRVLTGRSPRQILRNVVSRIAVQMSAHQTFRTFRNENFSDQCMNKRRSRLNAVRLIERNLLVTCLVRHRLFQYSWFRASLRQDTPAI